MTVDLAGANSKVIKVGPRLLHLDLYLLYLSAKQAEVCRKAESLLIVPGTPNNKHLIDLQFRLTFGLGPVLRTKLLE